MDSAIENQPGINLWFEEELLDAYKLDRSSVDESWKALLEAQKAEQKPAPKQNGGSANRAALTAAPAPPVPVGAGDELVPLRGASARIAENMTASLSIPLATSQRIIPVKVIDENRRLLNHHRQLTGKSKISFTHLIGWAIVQAAGTVPALNTAYTENEGEPFRIVRHHVNLGIAIDVPNKNGGRSLLVPNIKQANNLEFAQFVNAFDDLVSRGRANKLTADDFAGTTISLTNPGTVGTLSSVPRLMVGQGAIIATGAMDYPAGVKGLAADSLAQLGVSKVMSVTCTYDHRIIQGAESGAFLGRLEALLNGEDGFYDDVFTGLHVPYHAVRWESDKPSSGQGGMVPVSDMAKQAAVIELIRAYRVRGHLMADLDPLGGSTSGSHYHPELDPLNYGLTVWDLDRSFNMGTLGVEVGEEGSRHGTLREILDLLRQTYCGKIACEYMHIQSPEEKAWLQRRMEATGNRPMLDIQEKKQILHDLVRVEEFEHFLHSRFVGQKRFSLEGAETAVPILEEILDLAGESNVAEIVIGMAHRGRLTVLATCVGKPLPEIFSEFEGFSDPDSIQGSGDVKYHLGATNVRQTRHGAELVVSVSPNPSHLEAVDPVVVGIVRPKQDRLGDIERARVIPILIHGDAAFAGQGVVAETLNLSQLEGYATGGTLHLIINNQIGFTTLPSGSRSTVYSTDVARMVQAPIFHVNGDDPEAATRVARLAFEFRQEFKKDVVIDMVCYRRHGHNEGDDPGYTQPILYRKIKDHPAVGVLYAKQLEREKLISKGEAEAVRKQQVDLLAKEFDLAKGKVHANTHEEEGFGSDQAVPFSFPPTSAAPIETLRRVVESTATFPRAFTVHPKLKGFVDKRVEALANGGPIDWAFAEMLAFGSLVLEGTPVRLSGQDSGRGTFSQRHLAFYDFDDGEKYIPLQHLSGDQAHFDVFDSSLSEYAVLGFEFGYSVADPLTLTLWEAQFGDFANGAQIMIDQFISTAQEKWGQPTGLVMLLPHGQEGQGPEHSSARLERFLTLCARENMQICNCTTPAQYFHLLRRQMREGADMRGKRKPLVIFTPKSLLRHPKAVSTFAELTTGKFQDVLPGAAPADLAKVTRLLFCSGKVYYDLLARFEAVKPTNIAIIRIEQLYPFNTDQVESILLRHPNATDLRWVQEEPRNMGAWRFMSERIAQLRYVGRDENSSPATGSKKLHDAEQAALVDAAFQMVAAS
jgi:2-oxoglutarate dehydrogenase E1 component